ncbi:hypothetical protein ACIP61_01220 [Pseudomonas fulva]|uniref:hypothetical protein n=1 Tax=Pseudomonas fulva TaxID=47880 RepID=UPI00382C68EB
MANTLNLGNIILPGDQYPSLFGFSIPVVEGLEGAYLFGDGKPQINRNYAPGKKDATIVGSLVSGNGFATFSENGYLVSGIAEAAEMTILLVSRDSTGQADPAPGYIGNNFSLAGGGFVIYGSSGATVLRSNTVREGASDILNVPGDPTAFTMQCLRIRNTGNIFTNLTSQISVTSTNVKARTIDSSNSVWIGRIPSPGFKGLNDQMAALVFSRSITDDEVTKMASWLRAYCLSKGVSL